MDDDKKREAKPVARIIWVALLGSIVMYTGLAWFLRGQRSEPPAPEVGLFTQVFAALAVMQGIASFVMRSVLKDAPYFTRMVVCWAIVEGIALYGLVLALLGGDLTWTYGFSGLSALLLALHAPGVTEVTRGV